MRHRILLAAAFAYLAIANVIWITRDTRPPFWDMAAHQSGALQIHDAVGSNGLAGLGEIFSATRPYPPFYHSIVAVFYGVLGRNVDAAQYANIPALLILLLATYGVARSILSPIASAFAATLVAFYPFLLWLSRETMVDYWLTSMVAAAIWVLLRTKNFSDRRWAIAFGVIAGLGMLTKWTFAFFIVLPFFWYARNNWKNAALSVGIGAGIAAMWYAPAAPAMAQLLGINTSQASTEGDPGRLTWQALVFYIRALEGHQLFLPLFAAFVAGVVVVARNFEERWTPIILWIVGGWLGLLIFQNKDPRYSVPLLPAVAIITAVIVERRRAVAAPILGLLLLQHYLVSFGVRTLPPAVVLAHGIDGPIPWNWNFYVQTHFGLWGPPAREDWQIERILRKIARSDNQPVRLAIVPDIPRFDSLAFRFYASLEELPVSVARLFTADEPAISNADYILVSETDQGPSYAATPDPALKDYILGRPERFEMVETFQLPNGNVMRLYRVAHS